VDASELAALEKFFPEQPSSRQTLADIITEKLAEFEAGESLRARISANDPQDFMNPKVMQVYTKVGKLMSRYKSGKLPKAFKIIPSLSNWEEILYLTRPDQWTPHALFEATKIFVSSFNAKMAQRFLNLFLLERVRDEIQSTRKLSYQLYMALKKSLYKPAAFFRGVLLPLCNVCVRFTKSFNCSGRFKIYINLSHFCLTGWVHFTRSRYYWKCVGEGISSCASFKRMLAKVG
jgi:essential nuclear protein 1